MSAPHALWLEPAGGAGASVAHDSAHKHVSGRALYTDDIPEPPGTLMVFIAMSSKAHAEVLALDLTAVRTAPHVVDVIATADVPGVNDVSPVLAGDDPMFADGLVLCHGQSLFAVAATSLEAARAAAALAKVSYRELPAIVTVDEAMAAQSFVAPSTTYARGDADVALLNAPRRLTGRIRCGGQEHFYLEGQVALAIPGEDGDVTVHSSTQHPSEIQQAVAHVLGCPRHAVTVEVRRMGGGFGGKESQGNLPAAAAALVARRTGRPAKVRYDRDDDFVITGKRHDFRIDYDVGFEDDGRIVGIAFEQAARCGMSADLSVAICDRAMLHADNCYYLPAVRIVSHRCKTNTVSNTAFRGFGGPQGMLGIERVMDHIAHVLRLDPLTVRRRNFYAPAAEASAGDRVLTPYHMQVDDCVIAEIVDDLCASSDYAARRAAIRAWNAKSPVIKRGIALTPVKFGISFTLTHLNQAGALVQVYADGSIQLNHGGTEMGQGLNQKVAQVLAEEFAVPLQAVRITATNTSKVPNTSPTAASSGTDLNGMATRDAATQIKARMAAFLAARAQTTADQVTFADGHVQVGEGERLAFPDAVMACYRGRVQLSAAGFYATPKITWNRVEGRGRPFFYFAYGAAVTEVALDTLTGENRILRADILHDAGKSLNPAIDLGQVEGGYVQGAGWLTTEELVFGRDGRLLTHAPSTYKIPACGDRPPVMNVRLWDRGRNAEETIYRSKAVGEPPLMLGISALMALSDALAQTAGGDAAYPSLDAPATPERLLLTHLALQPISG